MGVAVITGVSGGLGEALAREFRRHAFTVIGISRTAPRRDTVDEFMAGDLTSPDVRAMLIRSLSDRFGRVDVLINNAGIGAYATWEELDESSLRYLFEVDFFAPVALTRAMIPLLAAGRGTVVNISSVAATVPVACMGAYNAAKAALRLFSESLRMEIGNRDIHVITVCPGRIETGFSRRALGGRRPPETPGRGTATPQTLARRVYRACAKRRREVVYPFWYRGVLTFVRLFPGVNEFANRKAWHLDHDERTLSVDDSPSS